MAAHSSTYHHLRSCLLIGLVASASGFASVQRSLHASSPLKTPILLPYAANYIGTATSLCSTQTDVDTSTNDQLGGVATFEEWFTSNSSIGAKVNSVKHALFHTNSLRGLEFTSKSSSDLNRVAVVPRKMVLSVPYSEDDEGFRAWDTNLSVRLWEECNKGKSSAYYGYCALLTKDTNLQTSSSQPYPSTAPDSLRHWTPAQKAPLESSEKGKKLLNAEKKQQQQWRKKFDSLSANETQNMTYEQFQWAMEAVHSRAFRGDFGALDGGDGGPLRKLASLLLPLSALAFGAVYATDPSMNDYYLPVALVAASPVILTMVADQKGSKEAVMLPLIDSANHLQEADSVIEYDPTVDSFVLSLGRKCLVKEVDEAGERAQVCISYGIRGDSELLLNYGFLRGVTMEEVKEDADRNEIRKRLAEVYVSRNP
eukprot:g4405.t1 g4405   contig15:951658-953023(+)